MKPINHSMIELARKSRSLSQPELSRLLSNLNQSNLSKLERGVLSVTDDVIQNIANVLDYPVEFFYLKEPTTPFSNIYFRKRASIRVKQLDKIFSDIKISLNSVDAILEDIDLKEYPRFAFNITEGWTPESAAIRMREIMQIPNGKPIKDIITKIEELGIVVFLYDSQNEKFDGMTCYTDKGVPVIFVNKNLRNERLKSTIVHELFHLVLHIPCSVEPWRDVEHEANSAAAEFLMPANDCLGDLKDLTYSRLGELKSYWGVSKQLIIRRAKDLKTITESTYTYFMVQIGRDGERKVEKGHVDIDKPKIINTVMKLLIDELNYSYEDLAKKLCLSYNDFKFYFTPGVSDNIVKLKVLQKTAG